MYTKKKAMMMVRENRGDGRIPNRKTPRTWIRVGISTLVFIVLLALVEFMQYGGALFTVRGIAGLIVKAVIFAVLVASVGRTDLFDVKTSHPKG